MLKLPNSSKLLPHTNLSTPHQTAPHLKAARQDQIGTANLLKNGNVVASCSQETPIHFATGTATHSQSNSGIIRPRPGSRELPYTTNAGYRLKIRPTLRAPPPIAKLSKLIKLLSHTNPGSPSQHSALFENSSAGTKSVRSKVLKYGKVVASCSLETPIHFATGKATRTQRNSGISVPFQGPENYPTPRMPDTG